MVGPSYECVGFLDDNEALWGQCILRVQILGPLEKASELHNCHFVNGIGSPSNFWKKASIIAKTGAPVDRFETLVHPTPSVANSETRPRVVAFQNVFITSNVVVGDDVTILPNNTLWCNVGLSTVSKCGSVRGVTADVELQTEEPPC